MIGRKLGHYRIVEEIGAGGMGVVYRAHDEHLDRDVAVKVPAPDAFPDQAARRRFRTEALALGKLSSAHIAQVYDFAEQEGVDFLAMELVPGRSLAERSSEEPLPEAEVVRLGIQLASALEEAHGQGIVHRDLKPGNLMITPKRDLKVLDFGLARLARDAATDVTKTLTEAGTVTGTIPYMAPEQLRAAPMDARTDIWAAGVVLYELATGRRLSAGFEQVVLKCLEKDPARRYQSAAELKADLERLAAGAAPRRRLPVWLLAAAAAALLAVIGGLMALKPRGGAGSPIASLAVLPLANMTGDPAQEYFADGMTEALITELAGIRSLKVISRTSVMRFKKTDKTLPEIAKQLGVEVVVEGSVARGGGRVRVAAQLIRAASDEHLWAENFDRQEADALALHSEIAGAIAGKLRAVLSPVEKSRLNQRRKVKPEAYDLVLQGNHLLKTGGSPDVFNRAIGLFEKAVALDPQSVEAHAGLANAFQMLAGFGFAPYWDYYPRIRKEVDAALALDPNFAGAQSARAGLLWAERDTRGALEAERRAFDLNPGDATFLCGVRGPGPHNPRSGSPLVLGLGSALAHPSPPGQTGRGAGGIPQVL